MKPRTAFLATFGVFASLLCGALGQVSDSNVEAAIRDDINKANGDLTDADLAKVETLDLSGLELSGVTIPQGLVNMEFLDLSGNRLKPSIFSPTKLPDDLGKLKEIDLSGNILPNLNLIANITSLEIVRATNNSFDKLTVPGTLVNLVEFDVRNNGLDEITFEEGLDKLTMVNISKNDLETLDGLASLTAIEILDASENDFTKLTMPEIFSLKELNLNDSELQSFIMNEGFVNLEKISIRRNALAGSVFTGPVSFPNDLGNLIILDLEGNELSSFTVPAGLLKLEELCLERNSLSKLEFGGPLPSVTHIIAFNNKLKTLTLPEGMGNLSQLDLFGNQLTELTIQAGFPIDPEPEIIVGNNPDFATKVTLPEGSPEDLELVFLRYVESPDQIIYVPRPLPAVFTGLAENGDFELTVSGPLGTYTVFRSLDFNAWEAVGTVINEGGMVTYTQGVAAQPLGFFRVERAPDPEEG